MDPARFDQIARALAASTSRRQLLLAVGAGVAGITLFERRGQTMLAQQEIPTPAADRRPEFSPIYVSPDPLPVGFGQFLIDGTVVSLDPEAISLVEGTPSVPILAGNETVYIDPSAILDDLSNFSPLAASPSAAGEDSFARRIDQNICGGDDSQDVELYAGNLGVSREFVATHQSPVGNVRWNANLGELFMVPGNVNARKWCSGTLISEDLFLTAGHCFAQQPGKWNVPRINGTNEPISRTEIALNMNVVFQYQLDPNGVDRPVSRFPIIELVEDQLEGLDYAIVRLANNPGLIFGSARIAAADVRVGETVCIIGHPEGVPKRVEAGAASEIAELRIFYDDIDTAGGSSGSCILASPGGPIVGIHTNGGCDDPALGNNNGLIISALLHASPILRSLVTN